MPLITFVSARHLRDVFHVRHLFQVPAASARCLLALLSPAPVSMRMRGLAPPRHPRWRASAVSAGLLLRSLSRLPGRHYGWRPPLFFSSAPMRNERKSSRGFRSVLFRWGGGGGHEAAHLLRGNRAKP